MTVSEALEKPPVLCPLCRRNKAGPRHRLYACQACQADFVLESLSKISRIPTPASSPTLDYGGGGTHGPSEA